MYGELCVFVLGLCTVQCVLLYGVCQGALCEPWCACVVRGVCFVSCAQCTLCVSGESCACVKCLHYEMCVW